MLCKCHLETALFVGVDIAKESIVSLEAKQPKRINWSEIEQGFLEMNMHVHIWSNEVVAIYASAATAEGKKMIMGVIDVFDADRGIAQEAARIDEVHPVGEMWLWKMLDKKIRTVHQTPTLPF